METGERREGHSKVTRAKSKLWGQRQLRTIHAVVRA